MKCPAAGPNPTVTCPLKELGCVASNDQLKQIKERDLPLYPDRICTNGTVTFPATAGAKFRRELQFASPEWERMYGAARNTIEAANAHLKDDSY